MDDQVEREHEVGIKVVFLLPSEEEPFPIIFLASLKDTSCLSSVDLMRKERRQDENIIILILLSHPQVEVHLSGE